MRSRPRLAAAKIHQATSNDRARLFNVVYAVILGLRGRLDTPQVIAYKPSRLDRLAGDWAAAQIP